MLAPMAVNVLQQHSPHEGRELVGAHFIDLFLKALVGRIHNCFDNVFIENSLRILDLLRKRHTQMPLVQ